MNFLSELDSPTQTAGYEALGYLQNPFPIRGEVHPEIYVERPELENLRRHLLSFLSEEHPGGGFWAMEGSRGIGKSNFLQHLDWELQKAHGRLIKYTVHQYIPSRLVAPQQLIEKIIQAIGEDIFHELLKNQPTLPTSSNGTDLYRFFRKYPQQQNLEESVRFLRRWMSGHQTYAHEREKYNIWSKERMPPAVAFPYLRTIVDCLDSVGLLKKIILLLDEFEEVQLLKLPLRSEYIQALKGLINTFNWKGLFIIIAGQEGSFSTIGEQYTSLSDRWQRVNLLPISSGIEAIKLANAYKTFAHQAYLQQRRGEKEKPELSPSDIEIKAIYGDVCSERGSVRISQRDVLHELYKWVEERVNMI